MADLTNVALTVNIDFECHVDGKKENEMEQYQATVAFSDIQKLLDAGGESVKRILQTQARKGKFPKGRRVTVNEKGDFEPTKAEKDAAAIAQIADIDDEAQIEAMWAILQAKKAARAQQQA